MPNLFLADMVRELSSSTGTGAFALDGAAPGHRAFAAAIPPAATFPYAICGISDESQWEVGTGTLSATGQLIRSPTDSSAGGGLVNFGDGLKTVALTLTADWADGVTSAADAPVTLSAVTGLVEALSAKQPATATLPAADTCQANDAIAIQRGGAALALSGGAVVARRAANGAFRAEGAVHTDGFVGAMTTTPVRPVHARHAVNAAGTYGIVAEGAAGGYGSGVSFQSSLTGGALSEMARITGDGESTWTTTPSTQRAGLRFYTANAGVVAEKMRLTGTGQLGIGTTAPAATLDVRGNMWVRNPTDGGYLALSATTSAATIDFSNTSDLRFIFNASTETLRLNSAGALTPGADNTQMLGSPAKRWGQVFAGAGNINTSDAREKTDIGAIPDAWLDAWGDVAWSRYHFIGGARWHIGLVAQAVHAAFAARGLDAFDIGLCCRDVWEAESDTPADEPTRKDRWGLRYDECFAMESAWVRRELSRLQASKSDKRTKSENKGIKNDA